MMKDCCGFLEKWSGFSLTVVRVVLGLVFVMHGAHKVFGWDTGALGPGGLANTVAGMGKMGMPAALIYLVAFTELLGGAGLVVGLLSRLAAFGILCVMTGALLMVHLPNGFFINWYQAPNVQHGYEYNLVLMAMSLAIILGGSGRAALDNRCCHKG